MRSNRQEDSPFRRVPRNGKCWRNVRWPDDVSIEKQSVRSVYPTARENPSALLQLDETVTEPSLSAFDLAADRRELAPAIERRALGFRDNRGLALLRAHDSRTLGERFLPHSPSWCGGKKNLVDKQASGALLE